MSDAAFPAAPAAARPLLDRLDPRLRVLATLATVCALLALRDPALLAALVPVAALLALAAGASARDLARRLVHVEGFLVVLALVLPLTVPGPVWITLGPLDLSRPGIDRAVLILLRVTLCAMAIFTLVGGLEPVRLGHGLARLGMPAKLVHLLLFAARWVALVRDEASRLHDALRARAFRASTSRHTLRTLAHFVGGLLVRAFERAERVDEAMRCRGFTGRFALVCDDRFSPTDAAFAAALALALAALLALDRLL